VGGGGSWSWWRFGKGISQVAVWKHDSRTIRGPSYRHGCESFSERKISVSTPMAAMLAGIVVLLGASLWVPSQHQGSAVSAMTVVCVITLLGASSWSSSTLRSRTGVIGKFRLSLYLLCLSLICFVRGYPYHFVSVQPFGFIYKAG
jgi:hypothetical protein